MEPETKPSSRAQSSLWPLALLGILSLLALFTSKHKDGDTPYPKDTANNDGAKVPPTPRSIETYSIPANYCKYEPNSGKNHAPWWEKASAIAQVVIATVTVGLLIANLGQVGVTRRQLDYFERVQAAQLSVEDMRVWTVDNPDGKTVSVWFGYKMKNWGPTAALHINSVGESGAGVANPSYVVSGPNRESPWNLVQGAITPESSETLATDWPKDIEQRKNPKTGEGLTVHIFYQFAYYDIFNHPHHFAVCRNYGLRLDETNSCFPKPRASKNY